MRYRLSGTALLFSVTCVAASLSCPFCSAPSLTLTEQFADADAVVLVAWKGGKQATDTDPGSSKYQVLEVPRNKGVEVKVGETIERPRYRAASEGDLFVLMGSQGSSLEWNTALPVTKDSYAYMSKAPSPDLPTTKRLEYFLKFLENKDEMVAMDAYGEFANAPYQDITPLKDQMPREDLRKWVTDPNTSPTRLGLYGLLLGLCGTEADAKEMEKFIVKPSQDYRLGLDGVISGYLLIRGAKGLDVVDKNKLASQVVKGPDGKEYEVPFSETYAVVGAIRFMWTYAEGRISKDRLKQSMRLLLNRPAIVDLIIPDLARWKDWDSCERLYKMYGEERYDQRAIKLAIVKFLYHASKDMPKDATEEPEHVVKAKKFLELIQERDPKTVRDAKRTIIR